MSNDEDIRLVEKYKSGDATAFDLLVEKYLNNVYGIAFSIVRNSEDAYDLAQDAFVKLFQKLETFKGDSRFYTWLYRITYNLCIDFVRKRRMKTVSIDEQDKLPADQIVSFSSKTSETPGEELDRKELNEMIEKCLAQLPENQRAAIILRDIKGCSYTEIAEILEVSEGTVMSRLYYARKKMAELLEPYCSTGKEVSVENKKR